MNNSNQGSPGYHHFPSPQSHQSGIPGYQQPYPAPQQSSPPPISIQDVPMAEEKENLYDLTVKFVTCAFIFQIKILFTISWIALMLTAIGMIIEYPEDTALALAALGLAVIIYLASGYIDTFGRAVGKRNK